MAGITLVMGGARSGKSRFAEELIMKTRKQPVYIATAQARDDEMRARIKKHQERRNPKWKIWEEPFDLVRAIKNESGENYALLVDCLTLWLSNLMMCEERVEECCDTLVCVLKKSQSDIVLVASEVGLGIVPECRLSRAFRDYAGSLNQAVAAVASSVYFVAAGLPLQLKG